MKILKNKVNKIKAKLIVEVEAEFYDNESSEETLRYCVEQDLEDAGLNVIDVSVDVSVDNTREIIDSLKRNKKEIAMNISESTDYYSFLQGFDYVIDELSQVMN